MLLLPGSDEATACAVAERVRDAVAAEAQPGSRLELAGACSLGVAQWREPLDAEALLEHADRALMLAKRTGKGRVAVANADVERELALLHADAGLRRPPSRRWRPRSRSATPTRASTPSRSSTSPAASR